MDGTPIRRRRIVRNTILVAATPLLLTAGYVGSVLSVCFANSTGLISDTIVDSPVLAAYFAPLEWYIDQSEWPGASFVDAAVSATVEAGEYIQYGR